MEISDKVTRIRFNVRFVPEKDRCQSLGLQWLQPPKATDHRWGPIADWIACPPLSQPYTIAIFDWFPTTSNNSMCSQRRTSTQSSNRFCHRRKSLSARTSGTSHIWLSSFNFVAINRPSSSQRPYFLGRILDEFAPVMLIYIHLGRKVGYLVHPSLNYCHVQPNSRHTV